VIVPRVSERIAVSVVFVSAMFMSVIDVTIVNVAVPTIGQDFHTSPASIDGVIIGFLVSVAVSIPVSGWLGDRFGGKRVLLGSIVVFTVASALCGCATSLTQLVLFRVLQGAGGGLMAPVGLAMLFRAFGPAERLRVSSILIIPTAIAPALGPVLGGLFVTNLSWRWVFFVNVPIGAVAFVFGLVFLSHSPMVDPGAFDLRGFLLAGAGLGLLMYGVSEGPQQGWLNPVVLATTLAGALLTVAMVVLELRVPQPMLDLRVFADRLFRSCSVILTLASVAFFGVQYLVALFLQDGLGLSALDSGLNTFPEAIGLLIGSQLITRKLYPALGPRRIIFAGALGVVAIISGMSTIGPTTSLWMVRLLMLALGFSVSAIFIPTQAAAFTEIQPDRMGRASTLFNAQRQLGSAIGVAALTTVIAAVGPTHRVGGATVAHLAAYRVGFFVAAAIMLGAALSALRVSDAAAAPTMVARPRRGSVPAAEEPVELIRVDRVSPDVAT
jgi:EmrB/QacA subfamily drug resistance transporter